MHMNVNYVCEISVILIITLNILTCFKKLKKKKMPKEDAYLEIFKLRKNSRIIQLTCTNNI